MPYHYAGDEAGDVTFAFTKGASRYFVIALIRTAEPDTLRAALATLRKEHHLPESFEFSFHELTNPRLRENVLTALQPLPFTAWAIVVDKRNLAEPFRVMPRTNFHNFFLTELIRYVPETERAGGILMLDEFDRSGKTPVELGKVFKARGIAKAFKKITTKRSRSEPLVQYADMVAGAVLAKYNKGDDHYLRLIRGKLAQLVEYPSQKQPPS